MILARLSAPCRRKDRKIHHKGTKVILLNSREILCAFVVYFLLAAVQKQVPGHACRQTLNRSGFSYEQGMVGQFGVFPSSSGPARGSKPALCRERSPGQDGVRDQTDPLPELRKLLTGR